MTFGPTTLATRITLGRLLACPVFIVLFYLAMPGSGYGMELEEITAGLDPVLLSVALAVLLLQEASDVLDGYLARLRGIVTDFGKLLDPLADTLAHMGTILCLMWIGLVPLWLRVLMYYREAVVGTLRVISAKQGIVVGARISGKLKSIGMGGLGGLLVFLLILGHYIPNIPIDTVALVLSGLLAIIAVVSGIDYTLAIRRTVKEAAGKSE